MRGRSLENALLDALAEGEDFSFTPWMARVIAQDRALYDAFDEFLERIRGYGLSRDDALVVASLFVLCWKKNLEGETP